MNKSVYFNCVWALFLCISRFPTVNGLTTKYGTYGESFSFICHINGPVVYFIHDSEHVFINRTTCGFYERQFYSLSCNATESIFKITIPGHRMNDSFHNSTWQCRDTTGVISEFVLFINVPLYSLTFKTIPTDNNTVQVLENVTVSLMCQTNSIRPTAEINWYIGDKNISQHVRQIDLLHDHDLFISRSYLNYTGSKTDSGKTIFCTGFNTKKRAVFKSNEKTLHILYGPDKTTILPAIFEYVVSEKESVNAITCRADCSPNCTILWNGPHMYTHNGSILSMTYVNRTQSGDYMCTAKNEFGNASSIIGIVVNYPPEKLIMVPNNTVVNENDLVQITCGYESRPTSTVSWLFESQKLSINHHIKGTTTSNNGRQTSVLRISKTSCLEMGNYTCNVSNALGSLASTIKIAVLCSPRIGQNFTTHKLAISNSNPINITVPIISYPGPQIEWRKNKTVLNKSNKINITMKGQGNSYSSNLIIFNPSADDFGSYEIYAGKTLLRSFQVVREGRPDPPTNLTCKTKQDNIKVSWISAFNGGKEQHFTVYFKTCLSPDSSYKPYNNESDIGNGEIISSEINGLTPATCYDFKVRAENVHNSTPSTGRATCNTTALKESKTEEETGLKLVPIVAGVSGSIVLALVIFIVYIVWKKKTSNNKETVSTDENISSQRNNAFDDAEAEHMPKKERADVYTMVDKNRLKARSTEKNHEDERRYSKDPERKYASSTRASHPNQNIERNSQRKNLVYAELDLDNNGGKMPFKIRGDEYRTDYADIDLERRASPEDSSDEEQRTGDSNKIKKTKF